MNKSNMMLTSETQTDFWNDTCSVEKLSEAIQHGAVGATSNPTIVGNVIKQETKTLKNYLALLFEENPKTLEEDLVWKIIEKIGIDAARLLEPVFNEHEGMKGRLSLQVNPAFYRDEQKMIDHAMHLASLAPNIAIKAPCTDVGLTALEEMTANGIVVNGTMGCTVPQAIACAEAIERGLEKASLKGIDTSKMTPYVTIMVGRLDDHLKQLAKAKNIAIQKEYLEWAGIAVFKKAYKIFQEHDFHSTLLVAAYRNQLHWSEFVGGKVVLTIPYVGWKRFNDSNVEVVERMQNPVPSKIVDQLYDKFEDFRIAYDIDGMKREDFVYYEPTTKNLHQFITSYYDLLHFVREMRIGECQ